MSAGAVAAVNGNLEVTDMGTLTGDGKITNSGRLQLDWGSSTMGLASYQQTSIGTLALGTLVSQYSSVLAVTGTAQLSGNLILLNYTPVVGDNFTVVTAGAVMGHFNTIPNGMVETDSPTSVTVTQVNPPAGFVKHSRQHSRRAAATSASHE